MELYVSNLSSETLNATRQSCRRSPPSPGWMQWGDHSITRRRDSYIHDCYSSQSGDRASQRGQGDMHGMKPRETRHPLPRASPRGGTQDTLLPRQRTVATPVTCPHETLGAPWFYWGLVL